MAIDASGGVGAGGLGGGPSDGASGLGNNGFGDAGSNPETGNHAGTQGPDGNGGDYSDGSPFGGREGTGNGGSDGGVNGSESPRSTAFGRAEDAALAEVDPDDHATPRGYAEALSGAINENLAELSDAYAANGDAAPGGPVAERAHATTRAGLLAALDRQVTANAYDKPAYEDTAAWSRHAEERRDLLDARAKLEAAPVMGRAQDAAAVMDGVVAPGARPGEVRVAQVGPPGHPEDDPLDGVFGPGKPTPDPSPDTPAEAVDTRTRTGLPPGTPPVGGAPAPGVGPTPPAEPPGGAKTVVGSQRAPMQTPDGPARNPDTVIDGRRYGGHALDRMQERGIPPSAVEDTIRNGRARPNPNNPDRTRHYGDDNKLEVNTENGDVVNVSRSRPQRMEDR